MENILSKRNGRVTIANRVDGPTSDNGWDAPTPEAYGSHTTVPINHPPNAELNKILALAFGFLQT